MTGTRPTNFDPSDYPTSPEKEEELPFKRQEMVKWFSPEALARTGIKALLSKLFGAYADNRELQSFRKGDIVFEHNPGKDQKLWIDYVADLGDGWDSTYSIARLLAERELSYSHGDAKVSTARGQALVMGGDQVYPTASNVEYENRLEGPYRCALPYVRPPEVAPTLYAIPGNHDWYDGLTSFTRLFCQRRWLGGWHTQQTRSYFALKLSHDWWLWGIDVQLGSDIDQPQLDEFCKLGRKLGEENPKGVNIILCVAQPLWVSAEREGAETYENLAVFEKLTINQFGHRFMVGLSGDLHAYARYESKDGRQRFVAGGGGAYLFPTHTLPGKLDVPTKPLIERKKTDFEQFTLGSDGEDRKALYPPRSKSWEFSLRSLLFFWYSLGFSVLLSLVYLLNIWLVESASITAKNMNESFLAVLAKTQASWEGLKDVFQALGKVIVHAPLAAVSVTILFLALVAFADAKKWNKWLLGFAHTVVHILAMVLLAWWLMRIGPAAERAVPTEPLVLTVKEVGLFTIAMAFVGFLAGGVLWGAYLFLSHQLGRDTHTNEVLACQRRPDFKHFLRLCIDTDGTLTIYPIGIADVPRKWKYKSKEADGNPWFEPDEGKTILEVSELIEKPIIVRPARLAVL